MRLSKTVIEQIADKAVEKSTVPKRLCALESKRTTLAERIRKRLVSPKICEEVALITKWIAKVADLEPDIVQGVSFHKNSHLRYYATVRGHWQTRYLNFKDGLVHVFPQNWESKLTDTEKQKLAALCDEQGDIETTEFEIRKLVKVTCKSVTTTVKLVEIWPESKAFIPPEPVKTQLVAPTSKLNELISGATA